MSIRIYAVTACGIFLFFVLWMLVMLRKEEFSVVPIRHTACDLGQEPSTTEEKKLVVRVGRTLRTFLKHLDTYHGSDARTIRAMQAWNGRVKIVYDKKINVRFSKNTGCLFINPDQDIEDVSEFNAVLLRHLAHKTCCAYNAQWLNTYVFYLRVATEELGMDVTLGCLDCRRYGVCYRTMCPQCSWTPREECEKF